MNLSNPEIMWERNVYFHGDILTEKENQEAIPSVIGSIKPWNLFIRLPWTGLEVTICAL